MSKQEPEYEEGLEPLTSAGIRSMCVGLSDEQQSNFMVEIGAAIERMVESDRVDVLVDESGDFIYQLTQIPKTKCNFHSKFIFLTTHSALETSSRNHIYSR